MVPLLMMMLALQLLLDVDDELVIDHCSTSVNHSYWTVLTTVVLCRHYDHCSVHLH